MHQCDTMHHMKKRTAHRISALMKLCLKPACAFISNRAAAKEAVLAPLLMTLQSFRLTTLPGDMHMRYLCLCHNLACLPYVGAA